MKPKFEIKVSTLDNAEANVNALFDSGSFYTIIREDKLPNKVFFYPGTEVFATAAKGGELTISGRTILRIEHEGKRVEDDVLVSSQLKSEMIVGAKTMHAWDISINNENGHTIVKFGKDMRDPEITEVCYIREIVTPENLLHETVSLQVFLTYCCENEEDIDYKIKLLSFIERAKQIHLLLKQQYKVSKSKQPDFEKIRDFYDKNWPDYMRQGYNALSHAFGIFGWLGGDVEGGPPVEKYTLQIMEMLRRDILSLLHEWQRQKRHLIR